MAIDIKSQDARAIRQLIPLATLSKLHFEALCAELTVEESGKGTVLFKKGDDNRDLVYLLSGEICLQADGLLVETISADNIAAQFALGHQNPRQIDAVANTDIHFIRVKRELLDNPPAVYHEESNYLVAEDVRQQPDDWMTHLLSSPVFQRLPAANLQQIILGFKQVRFYREETVLKQGQKNDHYYLIKKGRCLLTRKPSPTAKPIKLAEFHSNDSFGEDSLLSGNPSNFSITALTDLSLLCLDKALFVSLIKEPLLNYVDFSAALQQQKEGATLIDVRLPDEFKPHHVQGSINMPFFSLRMQLKNLDRGKMIIIICADGRLSEAAAFYLIKCNFQASILKGGIKHIPEKILKKTTTNFAITGNTATIPNRPLLMQPPIDAANKPTLTGFDADHETDRGSEIDRLTAENTALKKSNQQLKQQCTQLAAEKKLVEGQLKTMHTRTLELQKKLTDLQSK